uniref:peptidylprolyl isomerase n=1 Tax=Coccolithus braarudii TaxID=221442 RepID=A0A7S0LHE3_9EUKA|mmetsp:Transcript_40693/g.86727  ORF Transcript_40693/g.86727 Transcript_40693/m.86727 type:complete len:220 (+) Transcript_40693:35-694(+)
MRAVFACSLVLAAGRAAKVDYATKLQQTLGSASIAEKSGDHSKALAKIGELEALLVQWRDALKAAQQEAESPKEEEVAVGPPDETIEFSMKQMHVPDNCARVSQTGSTMKVHYVGKLIKSKKMFASSFHTGSQPFKFILGSTDGIDAWNQGLEGMCEGERRRLMVPWTLGYGAKGGKGVPPYSDLQYDIELVELSSFNSKSKTPSSGKPKSKTKRKSEL